MKSFLCAALGGALALLATLAPSNPPRIAPLEFELGEAFAITADGAGLPLGDPPSDDEAALRDRVARLAGIVEARLLERVESDVRHIETSRFSLSYGPQSPVATEVKRLLRVRAANAEALREVHRLVEEYRRRPRPRLQCEIEIYATAEPLRERLDVWVTSAKSSPEAIAERLRKAAGKRLLARERTVMRAGETARAEVMQQLAFVEDYDVEITASAFIADPVVAALQHGLRVMVTAEDVGEGSSLSLRLRQTRLVEPVAVYPVRVAHSSGKSLSSQRIEAPEVRLLDGVDQRLQLPPTGGTIAIVPAADVVVGRRVVDGKDVGPLTQSAFVVVRIGPEDREDPPSPR